MLLSLAYIFTLGLILGNIFNKLKLPSLIGMLIVGIVLGPYALNLLDGSILNISAELRKLALIIILLRAGLALDIKDLKKVGRPAFLMSFVPASLEIIGTVIFAPLIFGISYIDAALLGSVIAAVSPAVIVPKMLKLMETGYGTKKFVPQLILAGASVDDIFVLVLFTSFLSLAQGGELSALQFINIPASIVTGVAIGVLAGYLLSNFFKTYHIRDTIKVMIILSMSFFMVAIENSLPEMVPFSSLLSVMSMGICIQTKRKEVAKRLSAKFSKLWVAAEIILFVLVGACLDVKYALDAGFNSVILVSCALVFRTFGVYISLLRTNLINKEKLFAMIAYMPKATVQAAIGAIPLTLGLSAGNIILTVSVVSIFFTASLGAFLIDRYYKKLLDKD